MARLVVGGSSCRPPDGAADRMGGLGSSTRSDVLLRLTPEVPTAARVTMMAMTLGRFRGLALALLTAWVSLGPVGAAFDSRAAMMALCDGAPCGVVPAVPEPA